MDAATLIRTLEAAQPTNEREARRFLALAAFGIPAALTKSESRAAERVGRQWLRSGASGYSQPPAPTAAEALQARATVFFEAWARALSLGPGAQHEFNLCTAALRANWQALLPHWFPEDDPGHLAATAAHACDGIETELLSILAKRWREALPNRRDELKAVILTMRPFRPPPSLEVGVPLPLLYPEAADPRAVEAAIEFSGFTCWLAGRLPELESDDAVLDAKAVLGFAPLLRFLPEEPSWVRAVSEHWSAFAAWLEMETEVEDQRIAAFLGLLSAFEATAQSVRASSQGGVARALLPHVEALDLRLCVEHQKLVGRVIERGARHAAVRRISGTSLCPNRAGLWGQALDDGRPQSAVILLSRHGGQDCETVLGLLASLDAELLELEIWTQFLGVLVEELRKRAAVDIERPKDGLRLCDSLTTPRFSPGRNEGQVRQIHNWLTSFLKVSTYKITRVVSRTDAYFWIPIDDHHRILRLQVEALLSSTFLRDTGPRIAAMPEVTRLNRANRRKIREDATTLILLVDAIIGRDHSMLGTVLT